MSPGELSFSELPTNVPWGTKFQRTYLPMSPGRTKFQRTYLPMSPGELSFSEPTYQCSLGN